MSRSSETYAVVADHQLDLPTGTAYPGDRVELSPDHAAPFVADRHLLLVAGQTSVPRKTTADDDDSTTASAASASPPKKTTQTAPAETGDAS